MKFLIAFAAAALLSSSAFAQQVTLLPEGQTLITLTVTEREKVAQDTLYASLRIESVNKDPKALQARINDAMQRALATAKQAQAVKVSTGSYTVYMDYLPQPAGSTKQETVWRGSQTIELESQDAQQLLQLAGNIQAMGFLMNNLSYGLSAEKADEVRDGLMERALQRAQEKADRAARALDKHEVSLSEVNVDSSMNYPQPVMMKSMRMAADGAEMASPNAEAGESEVMLNITVRAIAK